MTQHKITAGDRLRAAVPGRYRQYAGFAHLGYGEIIVEGDAIRVRQTPLDYWMDIVEDRGEEIAYDGFVVHPWGVIEQTKSRRVVARADVEAEVEAGHLIVEACHD